MIKTNTDSCIQTEALGIKSGIYPHYVLIFNYYYAHKTYSSTPHLLTIFPAILLCTSSSKNCRKSDIISVLLHKVLKYLPRKSLISVILPSSFCATSSWKFTARKRNSILVFQPSCSVLTSS